MCRKILWLGIILTIVIVNQGNAQELIWKTGVDGFFDNREFYNKYTETNTYTGGNTFAQFGFALDEHNSFMTGVNLFYESGAKSELQHLTPIAYFHHKKDKLELLFGSFNRRDRGDLPLILLNDTMRYFRPQMQGLYLAYNKDNFSQNVWLDWTAKQTDTEREAFIIGATGKIKREIWSLEYHFIMHHHAKKAIHDPDLHIHDNVGFMALLGLDLSDRIDLDRLTFKSGAIYTGDRIRSEYVALNIGSLTEIYAQRKWMVVINTLYLGYGQPQTVGFPLFKADVYNRTDFKLRLFKSDLIKGDCTMGLHLTPGNLDFSQQLNIYISLNGRKKINRNA